MSAPAIGQPPPKALYLLPARPVRIDLAGEALCLKCAGHAVQRFPLARIERILTNRHVSWQGQALVACLSHPIAITWLDGHGHVLANALPAQTRTDDLNACLSRYVERPDWPRPYALWLRRRRLAVLQDWAGQCRKEGHPLQAHRLEALKHELVYGERLPARFPAAGLGWCLNLVCHHLQAAGLLLRYRGHGGQALTLADDLAGLLWAELNLDAQRAPSDPRTATMFFEHWANRHRASLLVHLGDLHRHLSETLETCP